MQNLVLIPARAGSTRVKNKNLRELAGKPLLAHVIGAARAAGCARVIVSTNSDEIAAVALAHGADVPFRRPDALSTATASSLSTILHALATLRSMGEVSAIVAFCPPTNPLVRGETIRAMFTTLARPENAGFNSIVTITTPRTHPFRIVRQEPDGRVLNGAINIDGKTINDIERSQDWPQVWEGSPACRMTRSSFFIDLIERHPDTDLAAVPGKTYDVSRCLGHQVSPDEAFDIDEESDLLLAEVRMRARAID